MGEHILILLDIIGIQPHHIMMQLMRVVENTQPKGLLVLKKSL
jgi:hypothetical protein